MKPLQLDHADLADRMIQGGALSFSSIWNHINKYLPDEAYTLINARLSRIVVEGTEDRMKERLVEAMKKGAAFAAKMCAKEGAFGYGVPVLGRTEI